MSHEKIKAKAMEWWANEDNKKRYQDIIAGINYGEGPKGDLIFPVMIEGGVIDQLIWSFAKKRFTEIRLTCGVGKPYFVGLLDNSAYYDEVKTVVVKL